MFVDIGSMKDGLVHVKDMSKDYFVKDHVTKYSPGQDIDCWVKFVDAENKKLGLQLFPAMSRFPKDKDIGIEKLDILKLRSGDAVKGLVVRASDYGVYVDIGAQVDAFLQKRKMKLGKTRIPLKSWEIFPTGSIVNAFVYKVERDRNRIALTTFDPSEWEDKIPVADEEESSREPAFRDDEELGGSTRAGNLRALQRILALDDEDDDDEDEEKESSIEDTDDAAKADDDKDEEEDSYEIVEELSQAELEAIMRERQAQRELEEEIDDIVDDEEEDEPSPKKRKIFQDLEANNMELTPNESQEMSTEELFAELSKGRDYVTIKEIKRWDYVVDALRDGDITEDDLKELIREAGGRVTGGRLSEDDFDQFIDLFADRLGLEDDENIEGDEDGADADDQESQPPSVLILDDTLSTDSPPPMPLIRARASAAADDDDEELDEDDDEEMEDITDDSKNQDPSSSASIDELFQKKASTNDLFQYVFNAVAGKKAYVSLEDALSWDFAKAMIDNKAVSRSEAERMFIDSIKSNQKLPPGQPRDAKALDKHGFEAYMEKLSAREIPLEKIPTEPLSGKAIDLDAEEQDEEGGQEEGEDKYLDIEESFQELSGGKKTVSFEAVLGWGIVRDMIEDEVLTVSDLRDLFIKCGAKPFGGAKLSKKTAASNTNSKEKINLNLDFEGFDTLIDLLAPFADFEEYGDEEDDEIGGGSSAVKVAAEENQIQLSASVKKPPSSSISSDFIPTNNQLLQEANQPSSSADEPKESDDGELLESVFRSLAHGKSYITVKDLMDWDFILELMTEVSESINYDYVVQGMTIAGNYCRRW
jgi:hypothetical protein